MPVDIAVEMADKNVSADMRTSADVLKRLADIQSKNDKNDDKRVKLELEQKEVDVEQTEAQTKATEESVKTQELEAKAFSSAKHKGDTEESKSTKGKSPAEEQREKALSEKVEKGYSRFEQAQHSKIRLGSTKRNEKLAKSKNKKV